MKNIYFFSKSKLHFVEIKNYKAFIALYTTIIIMVTTVIITGGIYFYNSYINPQKDITALQQENKFLKNKILSITEDFKRLEIEIDTLAVANDQLRITANLPPRLITPANPATGGSVGNILNYLRLGKSWDIEKSLEYIEDINRQFEYEKNYLRQISSSLTRHQGLYKAIPALKPTQGSVGTQGFGMRLHPIYNQYRMHEGIDIITDSGTPVIAPGDGIISFTGIRGGFGKSVEIDHGFGYVTLYAHLSEIKVSEGQRVKRGEIIAKTGNSGLSVGPHLHYEVRHNGIHVNPEEFFFDDTNLFTKENSEIKSH